MLASKSSIAAAGPPRVRGKVLVPPNRRARLFNLTRDVHRLLRERHFLALTRWPALQRGLLIPLLVAVLTVKDVFSKQAAESALLRFSLIGQDIVVRKPGWA